MDISDFIEKQPITPALGAVTEILTSLARAIRPSGAKYGEGKFLANMEHIKLPSLLKPGMQMFRFKSLRALISTRTWLAFREEDEVGFWMVYDKT